MYRSWLLLILFFVSCTKEYSLSEFEDFVSQPVLSGYLDKKYGVRLDLTRSLNPSIKDTVQLNISGALIQLVTSESDTIIIEEALPGKYVDSTLVLRQDLTYQIIATVPGHDVVVVENLVLPPAPEIARVNLSHLINEERSFSMSLFLKDENIKDYWYWTRFQRDSSPQSIQLTNEQLYDLCRADHHTSSASLVFSADCVHNDALQLDFSANYFSGRTPPKTLEFEIIRIPSQFGRYLESISTLNDIDLAFREPPAPISNTSNGVGYVAAMNIIDTMLILR